MILIPSILTSDLEQFNKLTTEIVENKNFSRIQIDFVEEPFGEQTVSVISTYPPDFKPVVFDAHIMTSKENIETDVWEARVVGYNRIIGQVESIEDQRKFVESIIKESKYKAGIGIDLNTDVSCIDASMHSVLDVILLMSVKAGRGGQKFDEKVLPKIQYFDELRKKNNHKYHICVDGGVEKEMLPELEKLGVDEVVVGVKRLLQW